MYFRPDISTLHFSLPSRNQFVGMWFVVQLCLLLTANTHAIDLWPIGPGGGGWLYAGVFDPDNSDIITIGTDMSGVFRTKNGGGTWEPWNEGLISNRPTALNQTSYVQDLLAIDRGSGVIEYYAATHGGIFCRTEGSSWNCETSSNRYDYRKQGVKENVGFVYENVADASIPFSCFSYNGGDVIYAGAGSNRTGTKYFSNWFGSGLEHYPGIGEIADTGGYWEYSFTTEPITGLDQYSVWMKNLDETTWTAISSSEDLGPVRDISSVTINNIDYVVISTIQGIYFYNGSDWTNLCDQPLNDYLYQDNHSREPHYDYYRDDLMCWNVYLTTRGTLYASMHMYNVNTDQIPGGIYRMNLANGTPWSGDEWYWVGNNENINNGNESAHSLLNKSMAVIGVDTRPAKYHTISSNYQVSETSKNTGHIWLMNVSEGHDALPDTIFAGNRTSSMYSMVRNIQPYLPPDDSDAYTAWSSRVFSYSDPEMHYYMFGANGLNAPGDLDMGHISFSGTELIFQPVIRASSTNSGHAPILVQFNSMLHRSLDAGTSWDNICCSKLTDTMWMGHGYDEMQIHDIDFLSDGRIVDAAQDNGIYYSGDISHSAWSRFNTPRFPEFQDFHFASGTGVEVWSDGSGSDFVMATVGDYGSDDQLIVKNNDDTWTKIQPTIEVQSKYGIIDFELVSANECYIAYSYKVDTTSFYGIRRGVFSSGNWSWTPVGATPLLSLLTETAVLTDKVLDLEYMPGIDRMYCATGANPHLYMFDINDPAATWTNVPGPWEALTGRTIYEMATSSIGGSHILAFGVSPQYTGNPANHIAVVFRCDNAGEQPSNQLWSAFVFDAAPSSEAAQLKTIAISPVDRNIMYMGISMKGTNITDANNQAGCLHVYTGLWKLALSGTPGNWTYQWNEETIGTKAEGIVIEDIAFNPAVPGQLVIATGGQGLYYTQLPPPNEPLTAKYVNKSTSVVGLDYPGVPYSEITLDYDNDGREDLLVTLQAGAPRLYRNAGDGSNGVPIFEPITDAFDAAIRLLESARGCAAADYNSDGYVDLFIAQETYPMLLRNKGPYTTPQFENVGNLLTYEEPDHTIHYTLEKSWAGSWVDMDRNGDIDLLVTRADAPGASKLEESHSKLPFAPLINMGNQSGIPFVLMPNLFGSSSTDPVTASSVATADIDGDGCSEILIPSLGGSADTRLYRRTAELPNYYNEFNTRFPGADLGGVDAAVWTDLNRDALPDLVASARYNDAERVRIFMNDPTNPGHFIDCTAWADEMGPTTDLRPVDFDLDGWIDLVAVADATTANPGVHLLRNTGDAGLSVGIPYFRDVTAEVGFAADSERVSGLAVADFLGDGDADLLLGRELNHGTFYFSAVAADGATEQPSSHWIGVRLNVESGANNRSGVGAVVTVEADGVTTTQAVDGGSGLGGQQSAYLRFGLGEHDEEVTVQTRWPGGFVQSNTFTTVDAVEPIQDQTDPTVIESSLAANVYYMPDNSLTWVLTWDTAYSYAPDCDRVLIRRPSQIEKTYSPSTPRVIATSGRKSGGGYWHRFQIAEVPCELGLYTYTVVSDTHAPQFTVHTTASGQYSSAICADGEGDPNVIQE